MLKTAQMDVSEVRGIVAQLVREEPTPRGAALVAHQTVETMCREAAEYGLTTADVVGAVLRPVFAKRRGCDCPTCKARKSTAADKSRHATRVAVP